MAAKFGPGSGVTVCAAEALPENRVFPAVAVQE